MFKLTQRELLVAAGGAAVALAAAFAWQRLLPARKRTTTNQAENCILLGDPIKETRILGDSPIHLGTWLGLHQVDFSHGDSGHRGRWEVARRSREAPAGLPHGADVIALVRHWGGRRDSPARLLLIINQRIPVQAPVLEFPAGLVDDGEGDLGAVAARELLEETGFVGRMVAAGPIAPTDPWKSNETYQAVFMEVDGTLPANLAPSPDREADENMQVVLVRPDRLLAAAQELRARPGLANLVVDAKLLSFAQGMAFSAAGCDAVGRLRAAAGVE